MLQALTCRTSLNAARSRLGTCSAGCWPERDAAGNIVCYCGDAMRRGLGGTGDVAGGVIMAGVLLVGLILFAGGRSAANREDDHRARYRSQGVFRGIFSKRRKKRRSRR